MLNVDARGIACFFDRSKTVYAINFHKPFGQFTIWDVKLGDSKDDVKRRLGEPEKSSLRPRRVSIISTKSSLISTLQTKSSP